MHKAQVIINKDDLRDRVYVLAKQIQEDYEGRSLTIVSMLTGSFIFTADLIRHIVDVPMEIGMVQARSYIGRESGPIEIDPRSLDNIPIPGRNVLVVDDILDTGQTLHTVLSMVRERNPREVRTCVLLRKEGRQRYAIEPNYFGFIIESRYVVGYGLDIEGRERNRPNIAVLLSEEEGPSTRVFSDLTGPAEHLARMERHIEKLRQEVEQLRTQLGRSR